MIIFFILEDINHNKRETIYKLKIMTKLQS